MNQPRSLLHAVLDADNLRQAWNEVAENRGMAGVDHVRIEEWRRNWESRLYDLSKAVLTNTYKPAKLRLRPWKLSASTPTWAFFTPKSTAARPWPWT